MEKKTRTTVTPSRKTHGRTHSLLLVERLLNLRDGASPLTLVIDSLEQPAGPLLAEFASRAQTPKARAVTIFLSFATLRKPPGFDAILHAAGKDPKSLRKSLLALCSRLSPPTSSPGSRPSPASPLPTTTTAKTITTTSGPHPKVLVVIDSLNALLPTLAAPLTSFLPALLLSSATSLVAVYHSDVPVAPSPLDNEYSPPPLSMLLHLATAVVRVSNLAQETARQRARNRSVEEPEWGLAEGREGVVVGLLSLPPRPGGNTTDGNGKGGGGAVEEDGKEEHARGGRDRGLVLDVDMRRRSGRSVVEKLVLLRPRGLVPGKVVLLAEYGVFARPEEGGDGGGGGEEQPESTFDLGLTEKQRRDREGVVLPYFDAQIDIGGGEGGRILYEMGREDDFDDEEDEI